MLVSLNIASAVIMLLIIAHEAYLPLHASIVQPTCHLLTPDLGDFCQDSFFNLCKKKQEDPLPSEVAPW